MTAIAIPLVSASTTDPMNVDQLVQMLSSAGDDSEAAIGYVVNSIEVYLTMTICADTGECMESPFPYSENGLSRAEGYMMVYDALKIAGVGTIILNDEWDSEDDSPPLYNPLGTHKWRSKDIPLANLTPILVISVINHFLCISSRF